MTQCLRIAVADDEQDMREYFVRILPRLGHQVLHVAENGHQLVALCRLDFPDLVVTDIRMPVLDGLDAAATLFDLRPVPVLLITAHHDAIPEVHRWSPQVVAALVKPIKQAELRQAIANLHAKFQRWVTDSAGGNAHPPQLG